MGHSVVDTAEVATLLTELTTMVGRDDPYPRYRRLREISPVVRAQDGVLVVTRYADCAAVARNPGLGHLPADALEMLGFPDWADHPALKNLFTSMLALNPPDHTRLRRLVSASFTARRVQELRPAITAMVDDLLDTMSGATDFVDAFAFPLPMNVIGELLGVPRADRAQFQTLVRDSTLVLEVITPEVLQRADPASAAIHDYLADLVAERRRRPGDDLLSALIAQQADDRLTEDELVVMAGLLFAAGFETTTNLLANGLAALLRHPRQARLLQERPELAPTAVEELLRYDTPVQLLSRFCGVDVELGGITVSAGERVVAYLGAGNRDPERFADPDELRLDRADNAPLSFGGGIHFCLGAPLARLEAQVALPALLRRFPRIALAAEPVRRDSLAIRGYTSMPVHTG